MTLFKKIIELTIFFVRSLLVLHYYKLMSLCMSAIGTPYSRDKSVLQEISYLLTSTHQGYKI